MPFLTDAESSPSPLSAATVPAEASSPAQQLAAASPPPATLSAGALRLAEASRALWLATLSLMTAFMQMQAPAHRYLLARRIARNLDTLSRQDCFERGCRARFERLSRRWQARSEQFAPEEARPRGGLSGLFS